MIMKDIGFMENVGNMMRQKQQLNVRYILHTYIHIENVVKHRKNILISIYFFNRVIWRLRYFPRQISFIIRNFKFR